MIIEIVIGIIIEIIIGIGFEVNVKTIVEIIKSNIFGDLMVQNG